MPLGVRPNPKANVGENCIVVWPVELEKMFPYNRWELRFDDIAEPWFAFVVDIDDWVSMGVEWQSVCKQQLDMGGSAWASEGGAAVRLLVVGEVQPLGLHLARTAFGLAGRIILVEFAKLMGVALSDPDDLFQVLWDLVSAITNEDDEQVNKYLQSRAIRQKRHAGVELLEGLDEVDELFDRSDRQGFKTSVERAQRDKKDRQTFREKWVVAQRKILVNKLPGGSKLIDSAGAARLAKTVSSKWKGHKKFPPGVPEQRDVKHLIPEGCFIWRCNVAHAWAGHCIGHPRTSAVWSTIGHREALRRVVAHLWSDWLSDRGLSESACLVAGIFGSDGSGSSSSNSTIPQ